MREQKSEIPIILERESFEEINLRAT